MKSTVVRLSDGLLAAAEQAAAERGLSLSRYVEQLLQAEVRQRPPPRRVAVKRFRQSTADMGVPKVDLTKALAVAAALEDEAIIATLK